MKHAYRFLFSFLTVVTFKVLLLLLFDWSKSSETCLGNTSEERPGVSELVATPKVSRL